MLILVMPIPASESHFSSKTRRKKALMRKPMEREQMMAKSELRN